MAKNTPIPHDHFFKKMMSNRQFALDFCKDLLPKKILRNIRLESLSYINESHITPDLKGHLADVILRFERADGEQGHYYISLIIEHKSHPYNMVAGQLLIYLGNGYSKQMKEQSQLELIIPVVYYHGTQKWEIRPFKDLIRDLPPELECYVPSFDIFMIDVHQMKEEDILGLTNMFVSSALLLQKYILDAEALKQVLDNIFGGINPDDDRNLFEAIIVYFMYQLPKHKIKITEIMETLQTTSAKREFISMYEDLIQQGIEQGIEQGMAKGMKMAIVKSVRKGYEIGLSLEQLSFLNEISIEEVKNILKF